MSCSSMWPGSSSKQKSSGIASSRMGRAFVLERPHEQAPGVLAVVGALVLVAQHRQVARQVGELLGVGVVVLAGVQRNRHPRETAEVARPQPRRAHHEFARDVARLGLDPRHPTVRGADAGDLHVLDAAHPTPARALHVGAHHVDGARHPVDLEPGAAQQVVGAHQRVEVPDLLGRDHLHAPESERVVGIGEPLELGEGGPGCGRWRRCRPAGTRSTARSRLPGSGRRLRV